MTQLIATCEACTFERARDTRTGMRAITKKDCAECNVWLRDERPASFNLELWKRTDHAAKSLALLEQGKLRINRVVRAFGDFSAAIGVTEPPPPEAFETAIVDEWKRIGADSYELRTGWIKPPEPIPRKLRYSVDFGTPKVRCKACKSALAVTALWCYACEAKRIAAEGGPGLEGKYSADDLTQPIAYRSPVIACDLSGEWD